MREYERIDRIIELVSELWKFDSNLNLGMLLEKWIWTDYIESRGDIFHPEDTQTEQRLKDALTKAKSSLSMDELNRVQREILQTIREIWRLVPDQRLGQLLSNYGFGHYLSHPEKMMLRQTDEKLLDSLRSYLRSSDNVSD